MPKTYVERTLDTVVEFQALHRDQLTQMTEVFEQSLAKVVSAIDALAVQVVQMNTGVKQNSKSLERLIEAIDRQSAVIDRQSVAVDGHLKVAEQQVASIAELTQGHLKVTEQQAANIAELTQKHLRVAEQQSANMTELTKLVAAQAITVNTLVDRMNRV